MGSGGSAGSKSALRRPDRFSQSLLWAHSEYLRLLRSCQDGKVFDLIPEVAARYREGKGQSNVEFWLPKHPIRQARRDHTLRICAPEPFRLRWTKDGGKTWQNSDSRPTGIGGEYFDSPAADFSPQIEFTFFWTSRGQKARIIVYRPARKQFHMQNTHKGKVVVVTGASAGVGRAVATEFARQGAHIGLIARGQERLEAAKHEIEELGGKAVVLPADVANAQQVEQAAERTEQELGPIDIWVNDAMTTIFAPFLQITPEEFKRATEVTYLGQVYGTMAALKRMRARNRGSIVQVGSALAYRSIPLQSAYCGAKHAIVGFTDSIRSELLHDRSEVHITAVMLPAMNTPQFSWCRTRLPRHPQPVPPIFQPEVAARAIVWAATHKRREVYVGWPTVKAIYGNDLAPAYADRYLAKNGFGSQQTSEPVAPDRPDNLFQPVEGQYSAHGIFDDRAKSFSVQSSLDLELMNLTAHRGLAASAALVLAGLFFAALRKRR